MYFVIYILILGTTFFKHIFSGCLTEVFTNVDFKNFVFITVKVTCACCTNNKLIKLLVIEL